MTTATAITPRFTAESIAAQISRQAAATPFYSGGNQVSINDLIDQWVVEFVMPLLAQAQQEITVYRLPPTLSFSDAQKMLGARGIQISHRELTPLKHTINMFKSGLTGKNYQGFIVSLKQD